MAKWNTYVKMVTYVEADVEANSREEAWEKAIAQLDPSEVKIWEVYLENHFCHDPAYDKDDDDDYCPMNFLGRDLKTIL